MLNLKYYLLCHACRYFDTDGNDGNHPSCRKQGDNSFYFDMEKPQHFTRIGEECPYGYEFGVPFGYPPSIKRNEVIAYEIKAALGKHAKAANDEQ